MDFHTPTDQQRKILELVVSGKTNKQIAAALRISENTVKYHLTKRIYPALKVRSRSAANTVYLKLAANALRKSVVLLGGKPLRYRSSGLLLESRS